MDFAGFQNLIDGLGDGEKNTALEVRALFRHLIQSIYLPGDIKIVFCTNEELDEDYTPTGLGIGKRAGWARCNGLNGTPTMEGLVPLGHGDRYPNIGDTGGSEKHKLTIDEMPKHRHSMTERSNGHNGSGKITEGGESPEGNVPFTDYTGSDQPHNNMQPYIIVLYLMKL